ncbi:hypothetical protein OG819_50125 [Streptomyces sp. NBC_01549]|uniref:hypothetical protein n=1 Tax=Streptomyces sp. NBC_01549 TaxID=2975874 RepID=UPI00224E4B47|nr:hypothetical protein [Streptomyces sp. NBC_01549]MCX4597447.1 hypothetical protein [Streptomyces sp. NBC_01549]
METLLRKRLKALQYRYGIPGGFLAGAGLTLDRPDGPQYAEVSDRTPSTSTFCIAATPLSGTRVGQPVPSITVPP